MTLRQKQSAFALLVARLIFFAQQRGYQVTFGDAFRSLPERKRLAALGRGILKSQHGKRLAVDLNLFWAGKYLTSTEDHRPLGEWWEAQSTPMVTCRWGGRFRRKDGNHYEVRHP